MGECARGYAVEPALKFWVLHALKKYDRLIKMSKKRKTSHKFKYGIEIPSTYKGALELDRKN